MKKALCALLVAVAQLPTWPSVLLKNVRSSSSRQDLDAELVNLKIAVEHGDVDSVARISRRLQEEAQHRRRSNEDNEAAPTHFSQNSNSNRPGKRSECVLDDQLFALTEESKLELASELKGSSMQEALKWVRTGGWWHCASYGEMCTCHGHVRMVDWDHTTQAHVRLSTGKAPHKVECTFAAFGSPDIRPGHAKVCECSHSAFHEPKSGEESFHLHKRLTSKSYLQEMWVFLLRLLGRSQLLPLGTGDRIHHGIENWAARHIPGTMPLVLERVWIEKYIKDVVAVSQTGPRCLEWGNPATPGTGFNYANVVPGCTQKFDIQFDAVFYGHKAFGLENNIVYSDIDNLPSILTANGDHRMDLIFATQVFEHIANPAEAIKRLYESLLPGGALVFTAPQQAQFHLVPHDYFRYTKEGVLHLLTSAGFCVPDWAFAGGGDFVFDIARDAGLQVQDFPMEDIQSSFQQGFGAISDSAITVHAMGFKSPHGACMQSLPPITPSVNQGAR